MPNVKIYSLPRNYLNFTDTQIRAIVPSHNVNLSHKSICDKVGKDKDNKKQTQTHTYNTVQHIQQHNTRHNTGVQGYVITRSS